MKEVQEYLEEAIQNIKHDRAATKSLLMTLMKYMQISEDRHKEVGLIAAKYLETLQRSNEQLVKITGIVSRKASISDTITEQDKQDLFDIINSEEE
tara:strand:+ start:24384 stop:24671 length:288 start_codon:yes stop_codon:yes gene_type:complete